MRMGGTTSKDGKSSPTFVLLHEGVLGPDPSLDLTCKTLRKRLKEPWVLSSALRTELKAAGIADAALGSSVASLSRGLHLPSACPSPFRDFCPFPFPFWEGQQFRSLLDLHCPERRSELSRHFCSALPLI